MDTEFYSSNDIQKIFRIGEKYKSPVSLLNAEERGEIPRARREQRGKIAVRQWTPGQLPDIGKKFGFLKNCKEQHILSCFLSKGGVMKSSLLFNFARTLALNAVKMEKAEKSKILIIGLDLQGTITDYTLPPLQIESLEEAQLVERKGLYEFLFEKASLDEVMLPTDLPNLFIIPENSALNHLEKRLRFETRKEYFFRDKLLSQLQDFSVICFDNSPNWNSLIENSLVCADTVVSPIGCELGSYQALKNHTLNIQEFGEAVQAQWDNYFLIPTMLDKSRISQQIYGSYLNQYPENVLPTPIRRATAGQEALTLRKSIFEYAPTSSLADDYYEAFKTLWSKVLASEAVNVAQA
jgi:chromosome partitioning protein